MALIIEDGTGVVGANSYVTLDEAKAYAQSRGEPLIGTDEQIEGWIVDAADFLESFRLQFSGRKTSPAQNLQYPRIDSFVDGVEIESDFIPIELKKAQCQLTIDSSEFGGLMQSTNGYAVAREEVGPIKVEYAAGGRLSGTSLPATPSYPKAMVWIEPLLGGQSAFLTTVRV